MENYVLLMIVLVLSLFEVGSRAKRKQQDLRLKSILSKCPALWMRSLSRVETMVCVSFPNLSKTDFAIVERA